MKKCAILFLLSFIIITAFSCEDNEEKDLVNEVNKNGSVETSVTVAHVDSAYDVLVTKHAVWANGAIVKNIEWRDTIPALGYTTAINNDKEENIKKAYEIFITVK